MKHTRTKYLALLLTLTMLLGLFSACGGANSAVEASASESASEAAPEEAAAAASEPEPAAAESPASEEPAEESDAEQGGADTAGDPMEAMAEEFITYPLEGEDNTITMWYYIPPYVEFVDSNNNFNAIPVAEEATGVHIEFTEVSSTTASETFNLMIASGDTTDLLPVMEYYVGGLSKAYEENVIVDIGPYIDEYMPNYAAVIDCLDEKTVSDTLTDGKTLAFYQISDGTSPGAGFITRGDWLEEQGIEFSGELIGLDEFTDMMRTLHSAYEVPYTYYFTDGTIPVNAAFDLLIPTLMGDGFMTTVDSAIFRKGDEVMSGWTADGYRDYLEWVLQLMDEGVIYQDFLSLDTDRGVQNTAQGNGQIAVWQSSANKIDEIYDYSEDPNFEIGVVPTVTADPSAPYVWNDEVALVATNLGFSLSANCKNPELVCQWQNYFWTTAGYNLSNYGIEGESYEFEADGSVNLTWQRPLTVTGRNAPQAEMAQQLFTMARFTGFYVETTA